MFKILCLDRVIKKIISFFFILDKINKILPFKSLYLNKTIKFPWFINFKEKRKGEGEDNNFDFFNFFRMIDF